MKKIVEQHYLQERNNTISCVTKHGWVVREVATLAILDDIVHGGIHCFGGERSHIG